MDSIGRCGRRFLLPAAAALALMAFGSPGCKRNRPLPPPPPTVSTSTGDETAPRETDPTAPRPELDILLEPASVRRGESAFLTWEARNADQVTVDQDIGPVITSGKIKLFPEETTTYAVTAQGPGGVLTRTATVEVTVDFANVGAEDLESLPLAERFATFVKPAFFAFDSAELSEEARITLDGNIRWLNQPANRGIRFVIEGHCDRRGTEEYNLALGDKRSQVARAYLESHGIDGSRIATVSLGEERPFATGETETDYALNRRAHFVLLNQQP